MVDEYGPAAASGAGSECAAAKADRLHDVPGVGGPWSAPRSETRELFVQVVGDLVRRIPAPEREVKQPRDGVRWAMAAHHGSSNCDSTPFQRAISAARDARSAATPAGDTV